MILAMIRYVPSFVMNNSISIIKLAGFAVLMYSGSGVPNRIHNAMALNPAGTNHKYRQI